MILLGEFLESKDINDNILKQYNEEKNYERGQLMNYFIKHRLKYLMEHMGDFTK